METQAYVAAAPRTIIIVWSWKLGGQVADGALWTVKGAGRGRDYVLCLDRPASPAAEAELRERIQYHLGEAGEVYLFLHRRHGYTPDAIVRLQAAISRPRRLRCFLFGEGGDPIYLSRDFRGLLGTTGTFSTYLLRDVYPEGYLLTAVADAGQRLLQATHFDHIWLLYRQAFRARIFELREDLFDQAGELLLDEEAEPGRWYRFLSGADQQTLLLRLLSLAGKLRKGSRLELALRQREEDQGRNYAFDDFGPQLTTVYGEEGRRRYEFLVALVRRDVLARGQALPPHALRDAFDALLAVMPGATYN